MTDKVKRPHGAGSVERSRDKFRARIRVAGEGKMTLGTYDTESQAHEALDAYFLDRAERGAPLVGVVSLRTIGPKFLNARELGGGRGISIERDRWGAHIDTAHCADWPLTEITARDVRKFRDELALKKATKPAPGGTRKNPKRVATKRRVSRSTVRNTVNLLRAGLEWAVEAHLLPDNPAREVLVAKELRTDEPWTYLTPEEQHAVITCSAIPEPERLIVQFAMGIGMRKGELWSLRIADVHVEGERPYVFVRFGAPGQPPKNGKLRRVPMTALALDAAKRWLALLPKFAKRNPSKLMFPTRRGHCRHKRVFRAEVRGADGKRAGATLYWEDILARAGILRRVRFHDLRHTCGSSLVAGWWGPPWPLIRVRDLLGHSSITVTERYAHLAVSALEEAAYATSLPAPRLAHGG